MKRVCKDCGKEFELTSREIQFYKSKNLALPKRCKECREKNRTNNNEQKDKTNDFDKQAVEGSVKTQAVQPDKMGSQRLNKGNKGNKLYKTIASIVVAIAVVVAFIPKLFNQILPQTIPDNDVQLSQEKSTTYQFRKAEYLTEHFEKHGGEFPYSNEQEYLEGANKVISSSNALHKKEAEDGDDVYFIESTGELVIVSTDGYIRTYFKPDDGIDYFNRQ